jgi:hypothetical protein
MSALDIMDMVSLLSVGKIKRWVGCLQNYLEPYECRRCERCEHLWLFVALPQHCLPLQAVGNEVPDRVVLTPIHDYRLCVPSQE